MPCETTPFYNYWKTPQNILYFDKKKESCTISFSVSNGSGIIAPSGEDKDHVTEKISSKDVLEDGEVCSHVLIQTWYLTTE